MSFRRPHQELRLLPLLIYAHYDELDKRIAESKADKTYLLMALYHPEIPLHNNPAELDVRVRVRKRVVSYGPRSAAEAKTWEAVETVLATASKLGGGLLTVHQRIGSTGRGRYLRWRN